MDTNYEARLATRLADAGDWLQIQPGRDRLAPNSSFEQLRDLVRFGLDLYANRYRAVADDVAQKQHGKQPPSRVLGHALSTLERYRPDLPQAAYRDVKREVVAARNAVETESKAIDSRAILLAPLATAGMAALAMNHELSNDAVLLQELADLLHGLAESNPSAGVNKAVRVVEEYLARFNAYRRLFSPLADPEEREAVQRLPVDSVVSQVVRALRPRLSGLAFDYEAIPRDLLFPVGAFAEWSAIFQNMLFNAWNAMLDAKLRVVRFDGSASTARRQYLRVSDTGVGLTMPLEENRNPVRGIRTPSINQSGEPIDRHWRAGAWTGNCADDRTQQRRGRCLCQPASRIHDGNSAFMEGIAMRILICDDKPEQCERTRNAIDSRGDIEELSGTDLKKRTDLSLWRCVTRTQRQRNHRRWIGGYEFRWIRCRDRPTTTSLGWSWTARG